MSTTSTTRQNISSKQYHMELEDHAKSVSKLKQNFLERYKTDEQEARNIIRQMRIIHGCALSDSCKFAARINLQDPKNVSEDNWIKLSTNESLLYIIHTCIRCCEKHAYPASKKMYGSETMETMESDTDIGPKRTEYRKGPMTAVISKNANGTDELSVRGVQSETNTPYSIQDNDLFSEIIQRSETRGLIQTPGLTEYLDNITTTEADTWLREAENAQQTQTGGVGDDDGANYDVSKPTLTHFWIERCGFSEDFKPKWEEFKLVAPSKYPDLQLADLNASKDTESAEVAKKAGVNRFPTLVLFYNGKTYSKTAGRMSTNDIGTFVENSMAVQQS